MARRKETPETQGAIVVRASGRNSEIAVHLIREMAASADQLSVTVIA